MAANTSFKQQCPSCEEKVLIKDGKLVGKKVDCPKCKFRFVVEEPKDDSEDYEEVGEGEEEEKPAAKKAPAKPAAKTGSKSSVKIEPKKDANGKSSGVKKDAGGKPALAIKKKAKKDDDDEDDDKPSFKKKSDKGGSKKVVMVAGIAIVAVALLGVAGFFVFSGDGAPGKRTKGGIPGGPNTGNKDKGDGGEETKGEDPLAKAAKPDLAEASNHLVAGGDLVVNLRLKELVHSPIGRIAFDPASGFSPDTAKHNLGFALDDVDRFLFTRSAKSNWVFAVVRTGSAMKLDALKGSLKLKSGGTPIKGQEYFVTSENWREHLPGAVTPAKAAGARPLAFRLHDPFTLVLGDLEPMKDFLEASGKPALQEGGVLGAAPPPVPMPAPGTPGAAPAGPAAKPYSTIAPRLRAILDRIEERPALLASLAFTRETIDDVTKQNPVLPKEMLGMAVENAGIALNTENGFGGTVVLEAKAADGAKKLEAVIQAFLAMLKTGLENNEHFVVDWKQNDPARPNPVPMPGVPPAVPEKKEEDPDALTATLEGPKLNDRFVQFSARLSPTAFMTLNLKYLVPPIQMYKGDMELAQKQPTPHQLAEAAKALATQNKSYPRGAFERPASALNGGRPFRPNERVSWMADLLPHLGYTEVHRTIEFQHGWADDKNLGPAMTLIPYFINPAYPSNTRLVGHPRREVPVAATHYVGIAGIGLDAANYLLNDPAAEGKLGVFGYDRTTPLSDVGDNTVIMVQVPHPPAPAGHLGPWIAGGGSTVRGVPEKNSVAPFVSTMHNGKPGTYALMSDGSVRFIAADVADEVFKALAVVKKDKQVPLETVPKVEKKTELKAGDRLNP